MTTGGNEADGLSGHAPIALITPAQPRAPRRIGLMRKALIIGFGVLITVAGVIFAVQGLGYLHGSVMTGTTLWAVLGPLVAVTGLGIVALGVRSARR
jgi:hypothetical protein